MKPNLSIILVITFLILLSSATLFASTSSMLTDPTINFTAEERANRGIEELKTRWISPSVIIFVGVLITIVGEISRTYADKKNTPKYIWPSIAVFTFGIFITGWGGILESTEERKFQDNVYGFLTGGESFCHLIITAIPPTLDQGVWAVLHHGEHPLYDLQVRLVDLDLFEKHVKELPPTFQNISLSTKTLTVGNLSPHTTRFLSAQLFAGKTKLRFNIFSLARNGQVSQKLRMTLVDGEWVTATQVTKMNWAKNIKEVIFEKVDQKFPTNQEGKVEWGG